MVSNKIGKFGEVSSGDALLKAWKVWEKQHFWTGKMVMVLKSLGILYCSIWGPFHKTRVHMNYVIFKGYVLRPVNRSVT